MARQPEVFVRELDPTEAQRLVKITRTARDRVRLRRAGIVLASVQGRSPAEAAAMYAATAQYARELIHAFNEKGFAALDPKWSGGRPRKFGSVAREIVCRVATTAPQQFAEEVLRAQREFTEGLLGLGKPAVQAMARAAQQTSDVIEQSTHNIPEGSQAVGRPHPRQRSAAQNGGQASP